MTSVVKTKDGEKYLPMSPEDFERACLRAVEEYPDFGARAFINTQYSFAMGSPDLSDRQKKRIDTAYWSYEQTTGDQIGRANKSLKEFMERRA